MEKKILFLVHRYPKGKNSILEKDIVKELSKYHKITVIVPNERKNKEKTCIYEENKNIKVLYVKTGNYFNETPKFEKIFTIFSRNFLLLKAIKKYLKDESFDYIFGYTPFMAKSKLIGKLKKIYSAKAILILWDIFPQNAKDLGIIKNKIIFKFFKQEEKKMYEIFDKVICNCEGQINYIKLNKLKQEKDLIVVRNSEQLDIENLDVKKEDLKIKNGYSKQDIISIFGGNMGVPQKLENIVYLIESLKEYKNLKFIFIGDGTEKKKIKNLVNELKLENIKIIDFLERKKYEEYLYMTDIGLISLNEKYTVPNFPAKVTGYCKKGIPIFASLDKCSYKFLGKFIEENKIGVRTKAGNLEENKKDFLKLVKNLESYNCLDIKKIFEREFLTEVNVKRFNEILK